MEHRQRSATNRLRQPALRTAALIGAGVLALGPAAAASAKPAANRGAQAVSPHRHHPAPAAHRDSQPIRVMGLSIRRGDTLIAIMKRNRLAGPDNMAMILTAGKRPEARHLRPGGKVAVVIARRGSRDHIESIRFGLDARAIEALRAKKATRTADKARARPAVALPLTLSEPLTHPKVTSPYGWRVHPVLGDRRFHKGVDFGAPKGTPVLAAADGVVTDVGRRGNYGEYILLRHGDRVQTAYAHLSGFAHGLRVGANVVRGQIIGYVGRSGLATGPHLYYEVMLDGNRLDPLKIAAKPAVPAPARTVTRVAEGPTGD